MRRNATPHGLKTSHAYYNQVWARDAFISSLGGNLSGDPTVLQTSRRSLDTFRKTQAPLGQVANFFDLATERPEFGWSGSTDSSCWYVIGLASLFSATDDRTLLGPLLDAAVDAYRFVRYQDANNSWLVDSPQGADWMDAAIQRTGKTLYNNILFLAATNCLSSLITSAKRDPPSFLLDSHELKVRFNDVFLPGPDSIPRVAEYWPRLSEHLLTPLPGFLREHYLHYISFSRVDTHFDTLSNLLCCLWGGADSATQNSVLEVIRKRRLSSPYPIRVLDPPYRKGDLGYDDAFDSGLPSQHRSEPLNYHNGAVWPFVGGFYVCMLSAQRREGVSLELDALASANHVLREGESVGFNEWLDAGTGEAKGQYGQSWSAGMYIAAFLSSRGVDPFPFVH